jgi:excisionase family DNA binding protein
MKRLLTVAETAEYLGRTEGAIRKLILRREISFVKHGRVIRLDVRELDRWIDNDTVPAEPGR